MTLITLVMARIKAPKSLIKATLPHLAKVWEIQSHNIPTVENTMSTDLYIRET